jgi:ribosomal protein S18 acetylase RimI-like enzyme
MAYMGEILVGAISCREEMSSLADEDKVVYIQLIGVYESYRRFGIGSKLIQ